MPLTPQDVEAMPKEIEEAIGRIMRTTDRDRRSHAAVLRSAIARALSSASATEAALRAERDEACEALRGFPEWPAIPTRSVGGMLPPRAPKRCLLCGAFFCMGPEPKHDPGCPWIAANAVLARIRKEPDHE